MTTTASGSHQPPDQDNRLMDHSTLPENSGSAPRRFLRMAFQAIVIVGILVSVLYVAGIAFLSVRIGHMDQNFSNVQIGDPSSRVNQWLGKPDAVNRGNAIIALSHLPEHLQGQCTEQYSYTIKTFFLPVTWLVYFDEQGRVIMTHRLD